MAKKTSKSKTTAFIRDMERDPNMGMSPSVRGKKGAKMPKDFKMTVTRGKK